MPKVIDLTEFAYPTAKLFGARLKALRLKAGLTQGEVGERTRITASYISQLERGQGNPTLDMIVKLARLFGTDAADMIRPEPDEATQSD